MDREGVIGKRDKTRGFLGRSVVRNTEESRFFEAPRETKIDSKSRRVRGKNYIVRLKRGKRLLARVIGGSKKMRVREIGIPLYCTV